MNILAHRDIKLMDNGRDVFTISKWHKKAKYNLTAYLVSLSLMRLACITDGDDSRVSSYDIRAFKGSLQIICMYIIIKIN